MKFMSQQMHATIKEIALLYGAKVIDRPIEIFGDLEPTISASQHVLKKVSMMKLNCYLLRRLIRCVQEFTVEALKNTVWRL
jgi:hypothetical protein